MSENAPYKCGKLSQGWSFPEFSPGNLFWDSWPGNYSRRGISITTNQRLFPTSRGNGKTINDGDSQTSSPCPIFFEERGASVRRLTRDFATDLRDTFKISLCRPYVLPRDHNRTCPIMRLGYLNAAKWVKVWLLPSNGPSYCPRIYFWILDESSFKQRLLAEFHGQRR